MGKQTYEFDLVVIGNGAGSGVAADIVAKTGMRVAIIEQEASSGGLLNWDRIPLKALLRAAELYDTAKVQGPQMGLRSASIGYNYPSIKAWKDVVIERSGIANSERYYQTKGITLIRGTAHFISPHEVTVNRRHVSGKYFLVASGSILADGGVMGLDTVPYITPHTALDVIRPPKSLFIIGGGATGCEFARLFSSFGSKIYIADESNRLLPREDQEVSELVEGIFRKRHGVHVLTHAKVIRIAKQGLMTHVTYLHGSEEHIVAVDQVLLAAGNVPAVDIGLDNAGVHYSNKGIEVNEFLETATSTIYAVGDVLGELFHVHTAVYESRVVANNIIHPRRKVQPNYGAVPRITFVDPEVASVGMSEADCMKRDLAITSSVVPLNIIARANIDNMGDGFVKVIVDKKHRTLVGATIVAPHAGEMIHELALAIQYGLTAFDVANTLHAFPSWSEAVRVACAKVS